MGMSSRPILLVGSVPCESSSEVFHLLSNELGDLAPRYPDGETGKRINWVRWQRHVFEDNPRLQMVDVKKIPGFQDALSRPFYSLKQGTDLGGFAFKKLGYAQEAIESYGKFVQLKQSGDLPPSVKFQVCLPTAVSVLTVFVLKEDRAIVESAYEAAMKREVDEMAAAIPAADLAIQWDIANEIIGYDGGLELHYSDALHGSVDRIVRQISFVPSGAEAGIHLCYGDPGHKHVIEPKDTATCVSFANAICSKATRKVDWIHLPIPRGWESPEYYTPLANLRVQPETKIYLGLVHHTDGIDGTNRRIALASKRLANFGIATECGFGRRDPKTIRDLLKIHRDAASLFRVNA
jgi:hypothetical protein